MGRWTYAAVLLNLRVNRHLPDSPHPLMPDDLAVDRSLHVNFFADRAALAGAVARLDDPSCARVSAQLPLRVNLSALQNLALIPLYHKQAGTETAQALAFDLLQRLGCGAIAARHEADLTARERFVVLLARALMLKRARLVIDQPGALLYDEPYPALIRSLHAMAGDDKTWEIYDYAWNRVLYE